jgi:ABC-type multidrug transport system fused ATPase/permease subunit
MLSFISSIITNGLKLGRKEIFLVFFLIIVSTLIELLGISLIVPLITIILDPNKVILFKDLLSLNFLNNFNNHQFVNFFLIIFFFIFLLKYFFVITIEYFVVKYSKRFEISLIIKLIDYHLSRPWIDALKNENLIIKNILTDIPAFTNSGLINVLNIFKNFFILSTITIYLIYSKGTIVIKIFLIASFILYLFLKFFKNRMTKTSSNYSNYMDIKYNLNGEITKGSKEIKIHNLKNFFLKEYFRNENLIANTDILKKMVSILPKIIIELLCILSFLLIVFFSSGNSQDLIPLLGLLSFIIYRSQPLLASLASNFASLQIFYYQIKNAIIIIDASKNFNNLNQNIELNKIDMNSKSTIEIKNLDFSYEDNDNKKIFSNLNLSLKFGKIYGLKGDNGSGKSTLADLILGLLRPKSGEILFNNKKIESFGDSWLNSVSYLSQNFFLFNDTLKNNITLDTKNSKSLIKERYNTALIISNLTDELKKFSDKDNTFLLSSGSNLSGGQKQRIAIARLIYRDSKIVVLDEPTSSLDENSSNLMMDALKKIKQDKLIIVISHSKKILDECDEIYVINSITKNLNNELKIN